MYEYYTFPGSGQILVQVFNSVAMICGSADFAGIMQVASLLGFIIILGTAIYKVDLKDNFVYLFIISAIWMVLMVPKSTVNIVETSGYNMNPVAYKVDNVPFGLAVTGHILSKFGTWMTKEAEKVNSLPNDLQYSQTGVLFGNRLISQMRSASLTNQILQDDWTRFLDQCAFYDVNFYHKYSLEELQTSTNLLETLGNTNQSLYTTVTDQTTKESEAMSCKQAYAILASYTNRDVGYNTTTRVAQKAFGYLGWTQDNVGPNYVDMYLAMGDSVLQYMFKNASEDSLEAIRQSAMINVLKSGEIRNAMSTNNQQRLSVALASAQAERQWIMSQQVGGAQASEFLPIMRATLEGFIIGMFPFVLFIALLAGIAAFKTIMFYVMTLFWIQLWAPLASILNLILSSYSQNNIYANMYGQGGHTLSNSFSIIQASMQAEAMAGYAYWLIPMLSFALVYGGRGLGNAMIGLVGSGQSVGNAAGSEVAKGNVNMGNVSYNNTSANKQSSDVVYTDPSMVGVRTSTGSYTWDAGQEGSVRASATRHDLPISSQASIKTSDAYSQKAAQSIQSAQSQEAMASAATTLGNAYTMAYATSVGKDSSAGKELASRLTADEQYAVDEATKANQQLSEKWGIQHSSLVSSALSLGLSVGGGSGKSPSKGSSSGSDSSAKQSLKETVSKFIGEQLDKTGLQGSLGGQGKVENVDKMARDVTDQVQALQEKGVKFSEGLAQNIAQSNSFREAVQSGQSLATNAQANYNTAQTATLSARQSYSEAQSYEQMAQKAAESNASITMDTSYATGQSYLGSGGHLGQMYQQPSTQTGAIQASGQSALEGKEALEQATAGSNYNPQRSLQSSDTPTNTVQSTHQTHIGDLKRQIPSNFSQVQQAAETVGISKAQIQEGISTQQSGLSGDMAQKQARFNQNYAATSSAIQSDVQSLKGSNKDALEATSGFQKLNSATIIPGAKSDGSNGNAVDMYKDIGAQATQQSEFNTPGTSAPKPFTENQQRIQQENANNDPLNKVFGNKSPNFWSSTFKLPKGDSDTKKD
ncbi:conjugal transfer protein TraG N-terminal domain-containing protein [Neisseria sp. Ec49-e6-T10]|uniref:conjugal transfer protein TraG N-terminal domain-containing protein n=1 Tax=Neisseria sp. Ec49-e6-T10 TaxID=3140744 RepID=UPI003EC0545F